MKETIQLPTEKNVQRFNKAIMNLFQKAIKKDEEDAIIAILYFVGVLFYYTRNPLTETTETINEFMYLIENKDKLKISNRTFFKLFSYVYIQLTELSEIYTFIFNLLHISEGGNYILFPFETTKKSIDNSIFIRKVTKITNLKQDNNIKIKQLVEVVSAYTKKEETVWAKIKKISKLENKSNHKEVGSILKEIYNNKVRNAFTHNNYRFSNEGMHFGTNHLEFLSYQELLELFVNTLSFFSTVADCAFAELQKIKDGNKHVFNCMHGKLELTANKNSDNTVNWSVQTTRTTAGI